MNQDTTQENHAFDTCHSNFGYVTHANHATRNKVHSGTTGCVLRWSGFFWEALNDRNIESKLILKLIPECWDWDFFENIRQIILGQMVSELW